MNMHAALKRIKELNENIKNDADWLEAGIEAPEYIGVRTSEGRICGNERRYIHIRLKSGAFTDAVKKRLSEMERERDMLQNVVDMAEAALKGLSGDKE